MKKGFLNKSNAAVKKTVPSADNNALNAVTATRPVAKATAQAKRNPGGLDVNDHDDAWLDAIVAKNAADKKAAAPKKAAILTPKRIDEVLKSIITPKSDIDLRAGMTDLMADLGLDEDMDLLLAETKLAGLTQKERANKFNTQTFCRKCLIFANESNQEFVKCSNCSEVQYCSSAHRDEHRPLHAPFCESGKLDHQMIQIGFSVAYDVGNQFLNKPGNPYNREFPCLSIGGEVKCYPGTSAADEKVLAERIFTTKRIMQQLCRNRPYGLPSISDNPNVVPVFSLTNMDCIKWPAKNWDDFFNTSFYEEKMLNSFVHLGKTIQRPGQTAKNTPTRDLCDRALKKTLTKILCFPATILRALDNLTIARDEGIRVDIIGGRYGTEVCFAEPMLRTLEQVYGTSSVTLTFIGDQTFCDTGGVTLVQEEEVNHPQIKAIRGLYENYMASPEFKEPALAVAFNPGLGLGRYTWHLVIKECIHRRIPFLTMQTGLAEYTADRNWIETKIKEYSDSGPAHINTEFSGLNPFGSMHAYRKVANECRDSMYGILVEMCSPPP